jgi:hypothetical protein
LVLCCDEKRVMLLSFQGSKQRPSSKRATFGRIIA